jgi:hypothetical protein
MRLPFYIQWVKRCSIEVLKVSLLHSFHYASRDFCQTIASAPVARLKTGRPTANLTGNLLGRGGLAPCAHAEIKRKNFGICFLTLKNPAVA